MLCLARFTTARPDTEASGWMKTIMQEFGAAFEPRIDEMRRAHANTPTPRDGYVSPEDLA
jgi:hypothetical protein